MIADVWAIEKYFKRRGHPAAMCLWDGFGSCCPCWIIRSVFFGPKPL